MKDVKIKISVDSKGAEKKVKSLGKEVKKTTTETGKAGGALSKGFAGLGTAIGGAIPMLGKLRAAIASTGIGAIVIAVGGLVSLFTSVGKKAAEFSKSLSNLESITGASASEMKELSDQAKELGSTTAFTASEVVELQTSLSKLGFKSDDIKNSTASILDLAAALNVGLGEAATVAGSLVKSFGLETTDTARVVDVMTAAASNSALSFDTIRESMKLVSPVSRASGVSIEKTAALLGVLADNGVKGSMAGTGLAATFIELNKKGISLEDAMKRVKDSTDPLGTALELAGTRGGKALITLSSGADGIDKLTESLENAEGTAKRTAELQLDNVSGDVTKLGSAWEGLLLSIDSGDGILSRTIRGFVQLSTSVLNFLTPSKKVQDSIKGEQTALFELESQLLNTNTSEEDRIKLIDELKRKHPEHTGNIDANKSSNEDLKKSIDAVNASLIDKIILQNADDKLQEKISKAADDKMKQLEEERKLRKVVTDNAKKYGLTIIEGTLLEQAAAQQREIASKKDQERYIKQYNGLRKGIDSVKDATDDYNESQGEMNVLSEANNELKKELGMSIADTTDKTEDDTESTNDNVIAKAGLIAEQESLLEVAKQMPETTEAEMKAKNRAIQVIELEIKRLKELGKVKAKDPKEQKKLDAEAARLEKELQDFNANTKEEARELEKDKLRTNFEELLEQLGDNEEAKIELTKSYLQRMTALKKKHSDEDAADQAKIDKKKLDEAEALADAELGVQNAKIDAIGTGFSILGQLAEENKGLQAVSLIGENAAGIAKQIINTQAANAVAAPLLSNPATAAAGAAAIARNKIALGIGIASSVAATAQGLAALGKGGSPSVGGNQGQGGAQAPSFNLVEGTESNAIQNTINGAGNKPVKAYVTSGDITTAQQADRQAELNSGF